MIRETIIFSLILVVIIMITSCTPTPATPTAFANMPNPASVFCTQNGGKLEILKDSSGGEYGMCNFPDGSKCEEWAYFRGECKPGNPASTPQPTPSLTRLTANNSGSTLNLKVGDTLDIALVGNPSTGYTWEIAPDSGTLLAQQGDLEFKADNTTPGFAGSPGMMTFHFKAVQAGNADFKLIYHRPFEPKEAPAKTFEIKLVVTR
jgi:putative hemolysin/predicted secreted protein